MLSLVGTLSVGQVVPVAVDAIAQLNASIGAVRLKVNGDLQAKLKLAAALTVTPPQFAVNISAVSKLTGQLQAALSGGIVPPGVTVGLSSITKISGQLTAYLGSLAAQVSAAASITSLLAAAGIDAYSFGGQAKDYGTAVTSATSGGLPSGGGAGVHCDALILASSSPAAWAALGLAMALGGGAGLTYLGSMGLSACIPVAVTAAAGVSAAVAMATPIVALQIVGLVQVGISLGLKLPSLTGNITALGQVAASLALGIAGGVSPPGVGVSLQVAGNATAIASLTAQLGLLNVALSLVASLTVAFGIGGISVYRYSGPVSGLGPDLAAMTARGLPGGGADDLVNALILATTTAATWTAMESAFKTAA
jgi:hypothetical protein